MRILLVTSASYIPTRGGATRANRAWLERMSRNGHTSYVITPALDVTTDFKWRQFQAENHAEAVPKCSLDCHLGNTTVWNGVIVFQTSKHIGVIPQMEHVIRNFDPDWVLVSSEDFGQARLRAALRISPEKVIYLAHTPQFFPFGRDSLNPSLAGTKAVSAAAAIVVIGEYTRQTCESLLKRSIVRAHPPMYSSGPFANYGLRNSGFVTIINPCRIKGISIFLSAATCCKELPFAALPGWATTPQDIDDLRNAGVEILSPCRDIDEVFAKTRLLLVPSLWSEGFGLVVIEAMLRGIPVLASNLGGLIEAKQNTGYSFPVNPIQTYLPERDEQFLPIPEIPEQDSGPWISAIRELSQGTRIYESASREARDSAERFVKQIDPDYLNTRLPVCFRNDQLPCQALKEQILTYIPLRGCLRDRGKCRNG